MEEGRTAQCADCKVKFVASPYEHDPERRPPCPQCGSKKRLFTGKADIVIGIPTLKATASLVPPEVLVGKPTLVLPAVIETGEKVDEGVLVKLVTPPWFEFVRLLTEDPERAYEIPPRVWEEMLAGAYREAGFDVILTPRSGDLGRDVIATKRGFPRIRIIDQMKAYAPGHLVKAEEVRAMLGVLHMDRNASKAVVTTTSDFAPKIGEDPFIAPAIPYRLELVNGERLLQLLNELARRLR